MRRSLIVSCLFPLLLSAQEYKDFSLHASVLKASFSALQSELACNYFDNTSRYDWHFFPASMIIRNGLAVRDMTETQKKTFDDLLKTFLSTAGYERTKQIMNYEFLLQKLQPNNPHRIPENYFFSIYGTPHADSIWAWKLTGHHLALNFTIIKNELTVTPFFYGIYPAIVASGAMEGKRVIKEEEDIALELVNTFSPAQKEKLLIQANAYTEILSSNASMVGPLKKEGISMKELSPSQRSTLMRLLAAYLSNMPSRVAAYRMKRLQEEDLEKIVFAWAGRFGLSEPHYYRIQGETFLVELDNTQANANHIHTVWRDFDGDYGIDLIREHYRSSPHSRH